MFKKKSCKNCIHYWEQPKWKTDADKFTGRCTVNPPQFANTDSKVSETNLVSVFAMTNEDYYCGKHTTKIGKVIERWYPVIYVAIGSILTTFGAYIIHILTTKTE